MSALILCRILIALHGDVVDHGRLCEAAGAIVATSDEFDPALVAAIPPGESGFNPLAIGPKYGACGPMQVLYSIDDRAYQDRRCRRLLARGTAASYAAGVQKLREARAFCDRRGNPSVECWIAGFQGGPDAVRALEAGSRLTRARVRVVIDRACAIRGKAEQQAGAGS